MKTSSITFKKKYINAVAPTLNNLGLVQNDFKSGN